MKRVAVVGASGFVGNAVVDRLADRGDCEIVPLVRSSGKTWRLSKRGIVPQIVDLFSPDALAAALAGCTHVVNCTRGDETVMLEGLANLLEAARKAKVECFVHLSSVAVYGDPPEARSVSEDVAPPKLPKGSYGETKLRQDDMVMRAAKAGLRSVILCPPNISGPYSSYVSAIVDGLRSGQIALLDGGESPCNLVDVDNLAYAVELSLEHGTCAPERLFITDGGVAPTWKEVVDALRPIVKVREPVQLSSTAFLTASSQRVEGRTSFVKSLKHVVSSDVRAALRKDPLWASIDGVARRAAGSFGTGLEDRLRLSVEGPVAVPRVSPLAGLNVRLVAQQLRLVSHSCAKAGSVLGYTPLYRFADSMEAYRRWYVDLHRMHAPEWSMLEALY